MIRFVDLCDTGRNLNLLNERHNIPWHKWMRRKEDEDEKNDHRGRMTHLEGLHFLLFNPFRNWSQSVLFSIFNIDCIAYFLEAAYYPGQLKNNRNYELLDIDSLNFRETCSNLWVAGCLCFNLCLLDHENQYVTSASFDELLFSWIGIGFTDDKALS
jgi:hypothetical protein